MYLKILRIGCLNLSRNELMPSECLRSICVKIKQEVWRCEGKNVFLQSKI